MGFLPLGRYVVTTRDRTLAHKVDINEDKLKQIADILGIKELGPEFKASEIRSISVYRGDKK